MSDENVTESITLSPPELMEIYTAAITPRNNVPGYVNGPRREIKGKCRHICNGIMHANIILL